MYQPPLSTYQLLFEIPAAYTLHCKLPFPRFVTCNKNKDVIESVILLMNPPPLVMFTTNLAMHSHYKEGNPQMLLNRRMIRDTCTLIS